MPLSAPGKFKTAPLGNSFGGDGVADALSGNYCTIIGNTAGAGGITADGLVIIGANAGKTAQTDSGLVAIGYKAAESLDGSIDCLAIGENSLKLATNPSDTITIGKDSGSKATTVSGMIAIGKNAGRDTTLKGNSVFLGAYAGEQVRTTTNIMIGFEAGKNYSSTGGSGTHIFIGAACGKELGANASDLNVAIGNGTLFPITPPSYGAKQNVCIGNNIMQTALVNTFITDNVYIGDSCGRNSGRQHNVAIGSSAAITLFSPITTGNFASYNILIGKSNSLKMTSGYENVSIGATDRDDGMTTAFKNVFLGSTIGTTYINQNNSICIGHSAPRLGDDTLSISNYTRTNAGKTALFSGELDNDNIGFNSTEYGSGVGVISIKNRTTLPTVNHTAGGYLFADGGALKWRGSAGTVTTVAAA